MSVSAVGSVSYVPGQLQGVGQSDRAEEAVEIITAPATPVPIPAAGGEGDDAGAVSTPLTRSSLPVQDALLGLQTGK